MNFQKASVEELVQEYEKAAIAYEKAIHAANSRSANRAADKIIASYHELRKRAAASHLLGLIQHENENVRLSVAAHALEFAPEYGEPVLLWIASRPGRNRSRAHYALKAWREGTLKFP